MKPTTIPEKFGEVTKKEERDIRTLHRHLLKAQENGFKVDRDLLEEMIEVLSVSDLYSKELRTLVALRQRIQEDGTISPEYDLFRKGGRTFLYAVFPNLTAKTPMSLFQGELVPIQMAGNPIEVISRIASLLRKGARIGPLIGDVLYLDISPLVQVA